MNENVQGKTFLLVMSILMIISGAFTIIGSACVACVGAATASAGATLEGGTLILWGIAAFVGGILALVAGILGCVKSGKPGKVTGCVVLAVIVIVLQIISNILMFAGVGSIIIGLALPVVYLVSAILKK